MIDHPEDYSGPSEPCGDLSWAPVGAGEQLCATAGMGYYYPDWQRKAIEALKFTPPPLGLVWPACRCKCGRPPGGWSDCGPDGETT